MKNNIPKATIQQFNFGDVVDVSVGEKSARHTNENVLRHGKVIKIHLAPTKVTYDLEFHVYSEGGKNYATRIHNVDGSLLEESTTLNKDLNDHPVIGYLLANAGAHVPTKIAMIVQNTGCTESTAKEAINRFKTADWDWFKMNFPD